MTESADGGRQREPRHRVSRGRTIRVTVRLNRDQTPDEIDAELIDVSRSGIRLSARSSPAIHEAVSLSLSVPKAGVELEMDASVCWTRPAERGLWSIGCSLSSKLPDEALTALAVERYVQRRRSPRQEIDLEASARWEATAEDVRVRLVNHSAGGFCMSCEQPASIGRRLLVHVGGDEGRPSTPVVAKVQWQFKTPEGYKIGCTFVHPEGAGVLRSAMEAHSEQCVSDGRENPRTLLALLVILLATVMTYLGVF